MMKFSLSSFVPPLVILPLCSVLAQANPSLDTPIQVSNQSPVVRIYGLPAAESAELLKANKQLLGVSLDIANNFAKGAEDSGGIWLDGESLVTTLRWRYGTQRWQWGVDLPYVYQSGGSLDNAIFQWHQLLGLSQADREKVSFNDIDYVFDSDSGERLFNVRSANHGMGDLRLNAAYPLLGHSDRAVALRTELKLPTADSNNLQGSGGTDLSVGISALDRGWLSAWRSTLHGTVGLLWTEKGDVLSGQREQWVAYTNLALVYMYSDRLALKLQLDAHSAFYDNGFDELGTALQASLGASFRFTERWLLDIAMVEDILVDSASDVVFHFNLKRGFGD